MSDEYISIDDFINAARSPPLEPTRPIYRSTDTPPPLDELDKNYDSDATETTGEGEHVEWSKSSKGRQQPSLSDSLLIRFLGPNYPDVALKAETEFFTLSPERAIEDRRPSLSASQGRMLDEILRRGVSSTTDNNRVLARAAHDASKKLNAVIEIDGRSVNCTTIVHPSEAKHGHTIEILEVEPEQTETLSDTHQHSNKVEVSMTRPLPTGLSSPRSLNVKPPPKVSLPSIHTRSPGARSEWLSEQNDSIATSPALAKFAITPADGHSQQQLPKMHNSPSQALQGNSPRLKQTLPSLETALSRIGVDGAMYSGHSSTISGMSPAQYSQFGPSPSTYSNQSPASAISPPRLPTNPSYWRTTGHETNHSTPSDPASTVASAGISTPATSYFGHSPSNSVNTPAPMLPESDNMSAISTTSSQLTDGSNQYSGAYSNGSFKCPFPGCTAAPFQTQYLLSSHANVHSNTRPHFCTVQGCSRGVGGKGFKRKNEMIRHGLVHQSPGYVCPFCPDQQHKYPRPDNLQRHVRVHHVDRDRDDPLLREVLAQRPEGGNRGRRRRLGS